MAINEDERKEMAQGGIPYTSQQNEQVEQKPKIEPKIEPKNNGEKLYHKCPTCGQFMEISSQFVSPTSAQSQPMNPYIREFPVDAAKRPPSPDKVTSDETDEQGNPLIEAKWNNTGAGRIPNTPI